LIGKEHQASTSESSLMKRRIIIAPDAPFGVEAMTSGFHLPASVMDQRKLLHPLYWSVRSGANAEMCLLIEQNS